MRGFAGCGPEAAAAEKVRRQVRKRMCGERWPETKGRLPEQGRAGGQRPGTAEADTDRRNDEAIIDEKTYSI